MQKTVAVNESGLRIGEDHQRAKLTEHEVELMRKLHEDEAMGYSRLTKVFDVSRTTVRRICNYQMRNQSASRFKTVHIPDD